MMRGKGKENENGEREKGRRLLSEAAGPCFMRTQC